MIVQPVDTEFKLVFHEGVEMPERALNRATNEWEKTGKKEQFFQYTFITTDEFAEKISFMVKPADLDLRQQIGKSGKLLLNIKQKEFGGKITRTVSLEGFQPSAQ